MEVSARVPPPNRFLSTPSARRATNQQKFNRRSVYISIHALREEGDRLRSALPLLSLDFYPRPPRGGRRNDIPKQPGFPPFLSTPSAWWATEQLHAAVYTVLDFYPRPPRGGRPVPWLLSIGRCMNFYPRPPRGGRPKSGNLWQKVFEFLSTPSARRATPVLPVWMTVLSISIHALREEGDCERYAENKATYQFLSTPSARRATSPRW